jgi:large subunit ribosomal protein L29
MKARDIREMQIPELEKRIREEEENLVHLKFQKATSQIESPIRIRVVRRDISRMKTILKEKLVAAGNAGEAPTAQPSDVKKS